MKRLAAVACALFGALVLPAGALATQPSTSPTPAQAVQGQASGTVIGIARGSFAIEAAGGRMSVVNALTNAANVVTAGDFPYVYGGGHAEAGIASIGIKGPGYNGQADWLRLFRVSRGGARRGRRVAADERRSQRRRHHRPAAA